MSFIEKYYKYDIKCKNMEGGKNKSKSKKRRNKKLKGGAEEIIDLIMKSELEEIKNKLLNKISNNKFCPKILGEGHFGKAYIPVVSQEEKIKIKDKEILLPVVVKESRSYDNAKIWIEIIDEILYIGGFNDVTPEALILMFTNQLWESKKSPHLPYMIGYGTCTNSDVVDKIITERHGLEKNYETKLDLFNEGPLWFPPRKPPTNLFSSSLNTLFNMFQYFYINEKNNMVVLPNGR